MRRIASLVLLFLAACSEAPPPDGSEAARSAAAALQLSPEAEARILDFVNYPGSVVGVLQNQVGIHPWAAVAITAHRDGADGVSPSADDAYFTTIAELDAVPNVDDTVLQQLDVYAAAHPAPAGETVEGVSFRGWESESVVWGVNHADSATIHNLLEARAANSLYTGRPYTRVAQMGAVTWVGTTALAQLRAHALPWWNCLHGQTCLAGTFDGVTFDEPTAVTALDLANQATYAQLTGHGVAGAQANDLIAARPYTSLAAVAATYGIGTATMDALRTYAQGGLSTCITLWSNAVSPQLPHVLLMSESDLPVELVSWPGEGGSAPTAATVLALAGVPFGYTAEVRVVSNYFRALEPSSSSADPWAAANIENAFDTQLTDVIYVALHAPPGSPNQAAVQVFLVGRTSCGDLVGIKSIAIET
ncbi:nuclease A inhibitor family protein [Pyxidicoccus caerfyrddinensis]|uniref:nuclease A inhibitor family protein n=1 Tax=Pyxidicoccus caerfyrddinensis TaxID=2709663 RepID=UPI0013D97183|nr:nuclease A inhibitor family protein [Pyxidicoccus caerfyrddinensis]